MGHLKRICKDEFRVAGRQKFRSQTPDKMDRWKSRGGKSQRREERKKEDQRRERGRRQKMQVCEKVVAKSRNIVFPMICGRGGSKNRLAKAAGAIWMRWKVARRCGAKHISKSKCAKLIARLMRPAISLSSKRTNLGPLLEGEMSKMCTPLWREAHLEVKSVKNWQVPSIFGSWDVEKNARPCGAKQISKPKVQNTSASDHFWRVRCRKSARRCGVNHISKSEMLIKGPDNLTCQLLPTSSKRKVKMAWGKKEREKRWWRIGVEQVVCGRVSVSTLCGDKLCVRCMCVCVRAEVVTGKEGKTKEVVKRIEK